MLFELLLIPVFSRCMSIIAISSFQSQIIVPRAISRNSCAIRLKPSPVIYHWKHLACACWIMFFYFLDVTPFLKKRTDRALPSFVPYENIRMTRKKLWAWRQQRCWHLFRAFKISFVWPSDIMGSATSSLAPCGSNGKISSMIALGLANTGDITKYDHRRSSIEHVHVGIRKSRP